VPSRAGAPDGRVPGRILGVMGTPPRRPAARPPARKAPPAWLRRWEDLHVAAQVAIVAPVAIVLLWLGHVVFLNQPLGRGFVYGVFWGLIATAAVVGASRSEKARRNR
jgi:hypothetical protein